MPPPVTHSDKDSADLHPAAVRLAPTLTRTSAGAPQVLLEMGALTTRMTTASTGRIGSIFGRAAAHPATRTGETGTGTMGEETERTPAGRSETGPSM